MILSTARAAVVARTPDPDGESIGPCGMAAVLLATTLVSTLVSTAPGTACTIVDHGAKPGNNTADAVANAEAIQRALASCAKVTVPSGAFKITPIVLPSHSELHLEHGATLVGSERWRDYGRSHMLPPMGNSGTQPGMFMVNPLISATDATNVTISGSNGTIDGNGWVFWPTANWSSPECGIRSHCAETPFTTSNAPGALRPPQLLTFTRSSWITVTNVTVKNPPYWGLQHFFCNDTYMSHVTILAPRWTRQIAGFMPFSTRRYTVEDSYVEVGDDAIAIMSGPDFLNGKVCSASEPCPVSPQSAPATGFVFRRVFIRGRSVAIGSEE